MVAQEMDQEHARLGFVLLLDAVDFDRNETFHMASPKCGLSYCSGLTCESIPPQARNVKAGKGPQLELDARQLLRGGSADGRCRIGPRHNGSCEVTPLAQPKAT